MTEQRWRYFDLTDAKCTLKINVEIGSKVGLATEADLTERLKTRVKEVDELEYERLNDLYDRSIQMIAEFCRLFN